jgi:hypothetical protein
MARRFFFSLFKCSYNSLYYNARPQTEFDPIKESMPEKMAILLAISQR